MTRRGVGVLAVVLASASVACAMLKGKPAAAPDALPLAASEELTKKWDKAWKPATIETQAASCKSGAGAATSMVTADFDNDTLPDYGLAVQTPDGVRLVALMSRGKEYRLVDVDELGRTEASSFLGIEKRGTKFIDPAATAEEYFSADTLAAHRCGGPSTAYIWSGSGFRRVVLKRP